MYLMRFDMRAPQWGRANAQDLYSAAIEMAAWGEKNGCIQIVNSEHHGSEDGYLPAPMILTAAMAGRTRQIPLQIAALILPLHDPVSLAEEMAVLDIASGGRVSYVLAVGYRPEEYAMCGQVFETRGERMELCIEALISAFAGDVFEFEGRPVHVTPRPLTPGGPSLLMGGRSKVVARRAARFGLGMIAQGADPGLEQIYRAECEKLGTTPGFFVNPPVGTVTAGFVAEDPEKAWQEMGNYLLHDARMYADWADAKHAHSAADTTSLEALRSQPGAYRIFTPDEAVEHIRSNGLLLTQPLCGGLPPDLAWPSLELLVSSVLPRVRGD
jgi:alkanesulfonate monooxygenase SsuD/methylene tetrahydromethanopterin reductase-like flavin-dependent oxidoreductase (luciferase family)